jgi:hypothetical protein
MPALEQAHHRQQSIRRATYPEEFPSVGRLSFDRRGNNWIEGEDLVKVLNGDFDSDGTITDSEEEGGTRCTVFFFCVSLF